MNVLKELMYTKSHEWVKIVNETTVVVGPTGYVQDALGDLVFVNLPEPGDDATTGKAFGDVEFVKVVSDILSSVTGQVEEINEELLDSSESVNRSPYDARFIKIKDVSGRGELIDGETYEVYLETLQTSWEGGGSVGSYVSNTSEDQRGTLGEIGFDGFEALFSHIPQGVHIKSGSKLPEGLGEMKVIGEVEGIAQQSVVLKHAFRGAGIYNHYIPTIIKSVVPREEFLTSCTPYQAEIGQGIPQSIFEYQIMFYKLTGIDVSNAPIYDGTVATAEAVAMCRGRKKSRVYLSTTTHPQVIEVVKIYCFGNGIQVVMVPEKDGVTDASVLRGLLDGTASCFYIQQPNYYGNLEEYGLSEETTHEEGAKYIIGCNLISLTLLSAPTEYGADITVNDGQPLDMPLHFGGPYLGSMTATPVVGGKLPGRIMGETRDVDGKRAYVLILQAREQHIRRKKVSSSVRSSQALCVLTASIYMAAMGGEGLRKTVVLCTSKAHYLKEQLEQVDLTARYDRKSFHKFITERDTDSGLILKALEEKGIPGGLPLSDREIPWCAAEQSRKGDIDQAIQTVKEVCGR